MKNLINKVCHHGRRITIHLKRHHRKYLFGALCSGILALIVVHTASTIGSTFANEECVMSCENSENYDECVFNCGGSTDIQPEVYVPLDQPNIWEGTAIVEYFDGDIVYEDTNGRQFSGIGTIKISSGDSVITILDRNLGATKAGTGCTIVDSGACGYHFQWGNNYGFERYDATIPENTISYDEANVDASIYGPQDYYVSGTFIKDPYGYNGFDRSATRNDNLWGGSGDFNDSGVYPVLNATDRQGPCPEGFHVPSKGEWLKLIDMVGNKSNKFRNDLLIPSAGYRQYDDGLLRESFVNYMNGIYGDRLWSSSPNAMDDKTASNVYFDGFYWGLSNYGGRANGFSIRCFKDPEDIVSPTCDVEYSTTGHTTGQVVAYLTGCSETITGTELTYIFTGNGIYTFEFYDLAGNTGNAEAEVTWIYRTVSNITYHPDANITFTDTEGHEFTGIGTITISSGEDSITMLDRNLGATTNDVNDTGSYGYYYQWGNNYGFSSNLELLTTGENPVDASSYGPGNYYNSGVYIISPSNEIYERDWSSVRNDNLWGGSGDNLDNNYLGYPVQNPIDRQGPCPDGYHVPSMGERFKVMEWRALSYSGAGYGNIVYPNNWGRPALSGGISRFRSDFFIPESKSFYINRYEYEDFYDIIQESLNFLQTSSPIPYTSGDYTEFGFVPRRIDNRSSRNLLLDNVISVSNSAERDMAAPVRCFKNGSGHGSAVNEDILFSIAIDDTIKVGKDTDFVVKVMKDGKIYKDYKGTVYFNLTDKKGESIDRDLYELSEGRRYGFEESDYGKKTFSIKIEKEGTYILELYESSTDDLVGSEVVVVNKNGNSIGFEYDTLKFNPYFSDEDNMAYQYAYHYGITTTSSIKNANMYSGLNRIAMAKMLSNYAENVLGMDDFDTSRNCKFVDVSSSLDASYDYGVTKACQLGIMGVNMPNNKFYPNGGVTRAEFATALSRLLYNTVDGVDKYYTTHINKLRKEGIITNTDPKLREKRGFVMLMLMRAGKTYED